MKGSSVNNVHTDDSVLDSIASAEPDIGTARESGAETPAHGDNDETVPDDGISASSKRIVDGDRWKRLFTFGLLPFVVVVLTLATGYVKWHAASVCESQLPNSESMNAARNGTVAILSYGADSVESDLNTATSFLTGDFRDSYAKLIRDVVIPGARAHNVSATANVPAVASVSSSRRNAELLVFVNQTVTVGSGVPVSTASTVRVDLANVDGHWLISAFNPI